MKKNDRLIWSSEPNIEAICKHFEIDFTSLSESEKECLALELNGEMLNDIRDNLDIWLDRPILAIAQYGMWGRTKTGVCEIGSNSIKDCLYSNDDKVTWFLDSQGDLRCDGEHEVGTNHYLYRTWKEDVTPRQKQMMMQRVIEGKPVERDIANITRSLGKEICRQYGWTHPAKIKK